MKLGTTCFNEEDASSLDSVISKCFDLDSRTLSCVICWLDNQKNKGAFLDTYNKHNKLKSTSALPALATSLLTSEPSRELLLTSTRAGPESPTSRCWSSMVSRLWRTDIISVWMLARAGEHPGTRQTTRSVRSLVGRMVPFCISWSSCKACWLFCVKVLWRSSKLMTDIMLSLFCSHLCRPEMSTLMRKK